MGIGQRFNELFNRYMIENNPSIVEEMIRCNRTYGRINDRSARAKFVFGLYLKYGVLHKNPLQEFERKLHALPFPETSVAKQNSIKEIKEQLENEETIVFDVWDVLLYIGLDEFQLKSLVECERLSAKKKQCLYPILQNFVIDNIYIHVLWNELSVLGKQLFLYNNSSYDNQFVEAIAKQHGYDGELYTGDMKEMVHVTTVALNSKDIVYKNVNQLGEPYRAYYEHNVVTKSADRVVNLLLHGDEEEKTMFYEYGVMCGGILTCGFCDWLNRLADSQQIDLFLFVARDGDIMHTIYQKHYAKHESEYMIFSRFASFSLIFGEAPEEYIDNNIRPRMERKNCDNFIAKILKECGLVFLEKYLSDTGLSGREALTKDNYEQFKNCILDHKEEIDEHFRQPCKAAEQYYRKLCGNHRNICVVDLGWRGKSIIYLKYFMERECGMDVHVTGAMIGAANDVVTQNNIRKGLISTYAFEDEKWRSMGSRNGEKMDYKETICTEALYSSTEDTLLEYGLEENGETTFKYSAKNRNREAVEEIHRGILDFAGMFAEIQKKCGLVVTPRDAYTPLNYMMKNEQFLEWIYQNYHEVAGALNGFDEME